MFSCVTCTPSIKQSLSGLIETPLSHFNISNKAKNPQAHLGGYLEITTTVFLEKKKLQSVLYLNVQCGGEK